MGRTYTGGGGGGGGGYVGGGGGKNGAGGAGGTDFCTEGAGTSDCSTSKGAGTGSGSVTISYTEPPSCTTVSGHGVYKKHGEPGRLRLEDNLSTNPEATQQLHVRYESGKVHFRLIKLEKASCSGKAGARDFRGEAAGAIGKEDGYMLSFSIFEQGEGQLFFESKLVKGEKTVEASGGPLKHSDEKIS